MWTKALDPFGDGSLVKSWTFDNTLTNEQNSGTFVCSHPAQLSYSAVKFGNGVRLKQERDIFPEMTSDCNHSVAALGPASFTVWLRSPVCSGVNNRTKVPLTVSMGGHGQRYNCSVEIIFLNEGGDTSRKSYVEAGVHKLGDSSGILPFSGISASRLAMFTWSYDPTTEETKIYMDTTLIHTATTQMKWIPNPFEIVTLDDHMTGTLYNYVDQLMEWNRPITYAEVVEIYNMTNEPPVVDTSDATANIIINATATANIIYPPQTTADITVDATAVAQKIYKPQTTADITVGVTALANINYFPLAFISTTVNATAAGEIVLNPYAVATIDVTTKAKVIIIASATHTNIKVEAIAKANVLGAINVYSQASTHGDVEWKPDGSKIIVCTYGNSRIYEYNLNIPWQLSGGTSLVDMIQTDAIFQTGMVISGDGKKAIVLGQLSEDEEIREIELTQAWSLKNANVTSIYHSNQGGYCTDLFFTPDGLVLFELDKSGTIYHWSLTVPWDISTLNPVKHKYIGRAAQGIHFKPDGLNMYIMGLDDIFYQYELTTAWDIDTIIYTGKNVLGLQDNGENTDCSLSSDGYYLYGHVDYKIYQYFLQVPWDLSTASNEWRFYDPKVLATVSVSASGSGEAIAKSATANTVVNATAIGSTIKTPIATDVTIEVNVVASPMIILKATALANIEITTFAEAFAIKTPIALVDIDVSTFAEADIIADPRALSTINVSAVALTFDYIDLHNRLDALLQCCTNLSSDLDSLEPTVQAKNFFKVEDIKFLFSGRGVIFDV